MKNRRGLLFPGNLALERFPRIKRKPKSQVLWPFTELILMAYAHRVLSEAMDEGGRVLFSTAWAARPNQDCKLAPWSAIQFVSERRLERLSKLNAKGRHSSKLIFDRREES